MAKQNNVPDMSNAHLDGDRPACEGEYEIVEMFCQGCGGQVPSPSSFRSPEYLRVFMMSGLCQTCQDLGARRNKRLREIARGRR